eukprot:362452-Chlamydomonas_euryale.AAC.12
MRRACPRARSRNARLGPSSAECVAADACIGRAKMQGRPPAKHHAIITPSRAALNNWLFTCVNSRNHHRHNVKKPSQATPPNSVVNLSGQPRWAPELSTFLTCSSAAACSRAASSDNVG